MDKKSLWQNKKSNDQPLRQPKGLAQKQNVAVVVDTSSKLQNNVEKQYPSKMEEIVANSSLKVDAPEFIPRFSDTRDTKPQMSGLTSRIQNRLKISRSESECSTIENVDNDLPYNPDYIENDLKRIRQIINTLTKDPGQFDNLLQIFMDTVVPYLEDIILLSDIVQILVNGAIDNANFRYTGAKLCWYIEQNCPSFRAELHLRCKKKLDDGKNLQDILLFFAELYVQLPHVNIYGALLVDSFKKLLSEGSNDSIKCICQALKLTGYSLESSNKNDLDAIMNELGSIKNGENGVNASTLNLISRILLLRKVDWGMAETEQNYEHDDGNTDVNDEYDVSDHAFFEDNFVHNSYLSDNTALTQEEEEFLATNMISNEEFYNNPDSDDDPEMDEEIQEAYEEFLKTTCKS